MTYATFAPSPIAGQLVVLDSGMTLTTAVDAAGLAGSARGTLSVPMAQIMADSYTYTDPISGDEKTVTGPEVMAIVKAITDRRWTVANTPAETAAEG